MDVRTIFRRGKSEIPASRIEMLESRREREFRREETEEERDWREADCGGGWDA